jgi:hypothetical protein
MAEHAERAMLSSCKNKRSPISASRPQFLSTR